MNNVSSDIVRFAEIATLDDFKVLRINEKLSDISHVRIEVVVFRLCEMMRQAREGRSDAAIRSLNVLISLCTFHFSPSTNEVYRSRLNLDGTRSGVPSDFSGDQNNILFEVIELIENPVLKSRIADVVWFNDRKMWLAAKLAVESYFKIAQLFLSGEYSNKGDFGDAEEIFSANIVDILRRALNILALSGRKKVAPVLVQSFFDNLFDKFESERNFVSFAKVCDMAKEFKLKPLLEIASRAENLAKGAALDSYPMAVKRVLDAAINVYLSLEDNVSVQRCKYLAVDQTLRMRDGVSGAMARASWTRDAIIELRAAGGAIDRMQSLRAELVDLENQSLDELAEFSVEMNFDEERKKTIENFDKFDLSQVLYEFFLLASPLSIDEIKANTIRNSKENVTDLIFSRQYIDRDGKLVVSSGTAPVEGDEDRWIKARSVDYMDAFYHQVVRGFIKPALSSSMKNYSITEKDFYSIVTASPFIPAGYEQIFALGFSRLFQGDFCSACFLLIPQLENSLRHVMSSVKKHSSKIDSDTTQEDRSLSGLYENMRPELNDVFGANLVYQIEILFTFRPGPALRHEVAHGKLNSADCYQPSSIYACWLIYRMVCLPLRKCWKSHIEPGILQGA